MLIGVYTGGVPLGLKLPAPEHGISRSRGLRARLLGVEKAGVEAITCFLVGIHEPDHMRRLAHGPRGIVGIAVQIGAPGNAQALAGVRVALELGVVLVGAVGAVAGAQDGVVAGGLDRLPVDSAVVIADVYYPLHLGASSSSSRTILGKGCVIWSASSRRSKMCINELSARSGLISTRFSKMLPVSVITIQT